MEQLKGSFSSKTETTPDNVIEVEKVKGMCGLVRGEDVAQLKEEVAQSSGHILMLVHPYSEQNYPQYPKSSPATEKVQRVERRMEAFMASPSERKPPVFVLEEEEVIGKTRARVEEQIGGKKVYIIPTEEGMSRPRFQFRGSNGATSGSWEEMKDAFRHLGVQKILIGGMYLETMSAHAEKRPGNSWGQYKKCVSSALQNLGKDFEVEVSSFTFPLARKDVHPKMAKRKQ